MAVRILLVEDDEDDARDLREKADRLGYVVAASTDHGGEACRLADEHSPDVVLMDIALRGPTDGLEAARHIQTHHHIPVVVVTRLVDDERIRGASIAGVSAVLHKPVGLDDLRSAVELAIHHARDRDEEERRRDRLRRWSRQAARQGLAAGSLDDVYTEILEQVAAGLRSPRAAVYRIAGNTLERVARLTRDAEGNPHIQLGRAGVDPADQAEAMALRAARERAPVSQGEEVAVPMSLGDDVVGILHVQAEPGQRHIEGWRQDVADYAQLGAQLVCECELDGNIDRHLEDIRSLSELEPPAEAGDARQDDHHGQHEQREAPES